MTADGVGGYNYQYDAEGRMTSVNRGAVATYTYDADGKRVQKQTGSTGRYYYYNQFGQEVWVRSEIGASLWSSVWLNGREIARYTHVPYTTTHFVHKDHLGSTRLLTKVDGTVLESYDYLPFGEPVVAGSYTNRRFTGQERDSETGLDYFLARHYASTLARFLQSDSSSYASLRQPQSWNLYAYTLNNPLRYVDPDGHDVKCKTNASDCLKAAQAAVANTNAAPQLYIESRQEKAGWLRRLFGQKTVTVHYIAIRGDVGSFRQLSQNASRLADLVTDKRIFALSISTTYSPTYTSRIEQFFFGGAKHPLNGGSTSRTTFQGALPEAWVDPNPTIRDDDATLDGIPPANFGEKTAHELLGHIWAVEVRGLAPGTADHKQAVLDAENEVRRTDPTRGQKTRHHD